MIVFLSIVLPSSVQQQTHITVHHRANKRKQYLIPPSFTGAGGGCFCSAVPGAARDWAAMRKLSTRNRKKQLVFHQPLVTSL